MIISCDKCNKKFEIADKLIPDTGRLLQCGSCLHKWHYVPKNKIESRSFFCPMHRQSAIKRLGFKFK